MMFVSPPFLVYALAILGTILFVPLAIGSYHDENYFGMAVWIIAAVMFNVLVVGLIIYHRDIWAWLRGKKW